MPRILAPNEIAEYGRTRLPGTHYIELAIVRSKDVPAGIVRSGCYGSLEIALRVATNATPYYELERGYKEMSWCGKSCLDGHMCFLYAKELMDHNERARGRHQRGGVNPIWFDALIAMPAFVAGWPSDEGGAVNDYETSVCRGDGTHAPRRRIGFDPNEPCFVCLGIVDEQGRVIDPKWLQEYLALWRPRARRRRVP